jgi:hypothetical protein
MTVAVATRPASLSLLDGKDRARVSFCVNPTCKIMLTTIERRDAADRDGLCSDCYDRGVIAPETAAPAPEPTQRTANTTTKHGAGWDDVDQLRRCGTCDTSIEALPADALYCSTVCQREATQPDTDTEPADAPNVPAQRTAEQATPARDEALAIAVEIVRFAYMDITEYQAETGLKAAVAHWSNGWVATPGIQAAARAWTPAGEDYDQMRYPEQGRANARALPILKAAIRAAMDYRRAHAAL